MCEVPKTIYMKEFENLEISPRQLKRMIFVMNALERGWNVSKSQKQFVFVKKHEGRREIFEDKYLETFVTENFNIDEFSSI